MIEDKKHSTLRAGAVTWWHELSAKERYLFWAEYILDNFSPSVRPHELTGREIELIYKSKDTTNLSQQGEQC